MEEEKKELPASSQQDDASDIETLAPKDDGSQSPEELAEANKRLFARAKKAEIELKSLKGQSALAAAPETKAPLSDLNTREVVELRSQGYTDKEILDLHEQASSFKVPISQLLKNPIVKEGIEAMRRKAKAESAVPTPTGRSAAISYKGKQYSELKTDAERREAFNDRVARGNTRGDSE